MDVTEAAEQAAEKGLDFIRTSEIHPSGPEGLIDFAAFTARLKSCPFKTTSFSAACKAPTYQSCPDTKRLYETRFTNFSAACEGKMAGAGQTLEAIRGFFELRRSSERRCKSASFEKTKPQRLRGA
jgi:hypothetical protein